MTDAALDTSEMLLAALDPEQREVALATRGAVCVLAGAGTGKTRAITYRIAYAAAVGIVNPAHVLALTFTVRAAGELRGRLRQLSAAGSGGPGAGGAGAGGPGAGGSGSGYSGLGTGLVRASTFHAAALRQLNYFWPRVVGGRPPQVIDAKASLVREAAKRAGVRLGGTADGGAGERCPTPPPRSSGPRSARSARTATRAPRPPRAARRRPGRTSWPRSTPPTRSCGANGT